MTTHSTKLTDVARNIARPLGRGATLVVGFAMTMIGLAMTATIVMLPLGVVIGLLGIAVCLCAFFAP